MTQTFPGASMRRNLPGRVTILSATAALFLQLAMPIHALRAAPQATYSGASNIAATEPETNPAAMPASGVLEPPLAAKPSEPTALAPAPVILTSAETEEKHSGEKRQKRIWIGLTIAQSSAATFDAWSTRRVISTGVGQELNPMLRPFAGNNSLYAAIQVGPLLLDYAGRRMMMSRHRWARHTWWIPQALGTAASLAGGVNNLGVFNAR